MTRILRQLKNYRGQQHCFLAKLLWPRSGPQQTHSSCPHTKCYHSMHYVGRINELMNESKLYFRQYFPLTNNDTPPKKEVGRSMHLFNPTPPPQLSNLSLSIYNVWYSFLIWVLTILNLLLFAVTMFGCSDCLSLAG